MAKTAAKPAAKKLSQAATSAKKPAAKKPVLQTKDLETKDDPKGGTYWIRRR